MNDHPRPLLDRLREAEKQWRGIPLGDLLSEARREIERLLVEIEGVEEEAIYAED